MNREIKFRGICIYPGRDGEQIFRKWIYGDYHRIGEEHFIFFNDKWLEVDKDTVGQYTGLKDKNGKEIYEGDIVSILDENICDDEYFAVKYINIDGRYELESEGLTLDFDNIFSCQCEVIGNIYDNPELLEESEQ